MAAPASPIPSYGENEPHEGTSKGPKKSAPPRKIKNVQMEIVGFEGHSVNLKKRGHQDYNKDVHESFVYTKVKCAHIIIEGESCASDPGRVKRTHNKKPVPVIVNVETNDEGRTWEVEEAWIGYKTEKRQKERAHPVRANTVHHEPGYLYNFNKTKPLANVRFMFEGEEQVHTVPRSVIYYNGMPITDEDWHFPYPSVYNSVGLKVRVNAVQVNEPRMKWRIKRVFFGSKMDALSIMDSQWYGPPPKGGGPLYGSAANWGVDSAEAQPPSLMDLAPVPAVDPSFGNSRGPSRIPDRDFRGESPPRKRSRSRSGNSARLSHRSASLPRERKLVETTGRVVSTHISSGVIKADSGELVTFLKRDVYVYGHRLDDMDSLGDLLPVDSHITMTVDTAKERKIDQLTAESVWLGEDRPLRDEEHPMERTASATLYRIGPREADGLAHCGLVRVNRDGGLAYFETRNSFFHGYKLHKLDVSALLGVQRDATIRFIPIVEENRMVAERALHVFKERIKYEATLVTVGRAPKYSRHMDNHPLKPLPSHSSFIRDLEESLLTRGDFNAILDGKTVTPRLIRRPCEATIVDVLFSESDFYPAFVVKFLSGEHQDSLANVRRSCLSIWGLPAKDCNVSQVLNKFDRIRIESYFVNEIDDMVPFSVAEAWFGLREGESLNDPQSSTPFLRWAVPLKLTRDTFRALVVPSSNARLERPVFYPPQFSDLRRGQLLYTLPGDHETAKYGLVEFDGGNGNEVALLHTSALFLFGYSLAKASLDSLKPGSQLWVQTRQIFPREVSYHGHFFRTTSLPTYVVTLACDKPRSPDMIFKPATSMTKVVEGGRPVHLQPEDEEWLMRNTDISSSQAFLSFILGEQADHAGMVATNADFCHDFLDLRPKGTQPLLREYGKMRSINMGEVTEVSQDEDQPHLQKGQVAVRLRDGNMATLKNRDLVVWGLNCSGLDLKSIVSRADLVFIETWKDDLTGQERVFGSIGLLPGQTVRENHLKCRQFELWLRKHQIIPTELIRCLSSRRTLEASGLEPPSFGVVQTLIKSPKGGKPNTGLIILDEQKGSFGDREVLFEGASLVIRGFKMTGFSDLSQVLNESMRVSCTVRPLPFDQPKWRDFAGMYPEATIPRLLANLVYVDTPLEATAHPVRNPEFALCEDSLADLDAYLMRMGTSLKRYFQSNERITDREESGPGGSKANPNRNPPKEDSPIEVVPQDVIKIEPGTEVQPQSTAAVPNKRSQRAENLRKAHDLVDRIMEGGFSSITASDLFNDKADVKIAKFLMQSIKFALEESSESHLIESAPSNILMDRPATLVAPGLLSASSAAALSQSRGTPASTTSASIRANPLLINPISRQALTPEQPIATDATGVPAVEQQPSSSSSYQPNASREREQFMSLERKKARLKLLEEEQRQKEEEVRRMMRESEEMRQRRRPRGQERSRSPPRERRISYSDKGQRGFEAWEDV